MGTGRRGNGGDGNICSNVNNKKPPNNSRGGARGASGGGASPELVTSGLGGWVGREPKAACVTRGSTVETCLFQCDAFFPREF